MADVTAMSVKNLKNTIASAGLDHDGIVDKEELIALARKALAVLESSEEEEVELGHHRGLASQPVTARHSSTSAVRYSKECTVQL